MKLSIACVAFGFSACSETQPPQELLDARVAYAGAASKRSWSASTSRRITLSDLPRVGPLLLRSIPAGVPA
jgi:hypothetical protein